MYDPAEIAKSGSRGGRGGLDSNHVKTDERTDRRENRYPPRKLGAENHQIVEETLAPGHRFNPEILGNPIFSRTTRALAATSVTNSGDITTPPWLSCLGWLPHPVHPCDSVQT
jgi:hypothetical protein